MRKLICLLLMVAIVIPNIGCCSLIHGKKNAGTGEYRVGCHLFGNILFGGIIGMLIDLGTGAHKDGTGPQTYAPTKEYPNIQKRYLAIHLKDGNTLILDEVRSFSTEENFLDVTSIPESLVDSNEWVVKIPIIPDTP